MKIENISTKMSQADLPLNPKEQKAKNKIEDLLERVKEAEGRIKEEHSAISKEKRYEPKLMEDIDKAQISRELNETLIININKWYDHYLIYSIRKMGKLENELKVDI